MRIVYMGTPHIAASILDSLASTHDVVAVYTRPDAISGRGNKTMPSPVKSVAIERGIPVVETKTLRSEEIVEGIRSLEPDAICVAAFGAILPREVLEIPRYGCLNVHASLLPRWRGAAPIERAILAGDAATGVCIMRMEEGLDTGDFCIRKETPIGEKTSFELSNELAEMGSAALIEALKRIEESSVVWTKQGELGVTYAEKIVKHELDLALSDTCIDACRKIHASSEAHTCHATFATRKVSLIDARIATDDDAIAICNELNLSTGDLVFRHKRMLAMMVDGAIEILKLKPNGKKAMDAKAFCAGIQSAKNTIMKWENI